jgi:hypothetical protein
MILSDKAKLNIVICKQKSTHFRVDFLCLNFKKLLDFSVEICYTIYVSEENK